MYTLNDLYVINREVSKSNSTPEKIEARRKEIVANLSTMLSTKSVQAIEIVDTDEANEDGSEDNDNTIIMNDLSDRHPLISIKRTSFKVDYNRN